MNWFNNLSENTQLILLLLGLVVLFLLVFANTKRNTAKQRGRRRRKFGDKIKKRGKD